MAQKRPLESSAVSERDCLSINIDIKNISLFDIKIEKEWRIGIEAAFFHISDDIIVFVKVLCAHIIIGDEKCRIDKVIKLYAVSAEVLRARYHYVFLCPDLTDTGKLSYPVVQIAFRRHTQSYIRYVRNVKKVVYSSCYGDVVDTCRCEHRAYDDKQQQYDVHCPFAFKVLFQYSPEHYPYLVSCVVFSML